MNILNITSHCNTSCNRCRDHYDALSHYNINIKEQLSFTYLKYSKPRDRVNRLIKNNI